MAVNVLHKSLLYGILCCVVWLALLNQLTIDDLYFLQDVKTRGIAGSVAHQYYHYSGRWIAYGINNTLLYFDSKTLYVLANLAVLTLFLAAVYTVIKRLGTFATGLLNPWPYTLISFTIVLTGTGFAQQTFYWQTQTVTYLLPFACILFLCAYSFSASLTIYCKILLAAGACIVGGSGEFYSAAYLALFVAMAIYARRVHHAKVNAWLYVCFVLTAICFAGVLLAPGNALRLAVLHQSHVQEPYLKTFATSAYLFTAQYFGLRGALAAGGILCFGLWLKPVLPASFNYGRWIAVCAFTGIAGFSLQVALFGDMPPARATVFTELTAMACTTLIVMRFMPVRISHQTVLTLYTGACLTYMVWQSICAANYARAYTGRKAYCQKQNSSIILTLALPVCDLYYPAEITGDTGHYRNRHIATGWNLCCTVRLKKP